MPRNPGNPVAPTKKEERYLRCTVCDATITLMLTSGEDRPMHRCQPVYKPMPFDIDLPGSEAPKPKPIKLTFDDMPKPPGPRSRPKIVL
jgi:hypothetical protein